MFIKSNSFTFRCDTELEMDSAKEKIITENPGYTVVKEKKDFKTKKSKGEIIDEFWLYTITVDLMDE